MSGLHYHFVCRWGPDAWHFCCLIACSNGFARVVSESMRFYTLAAHWLYTHSHNQLSNAHTNRYPCIVGAGRNAAILHYERNTAVAGPNDLVLVDAGTKDRVLCVLWCRKGLQWPLTRLLVGMWASRKQHAHNHRLSALTIGVVTACQGLCFFPTHLLTHTSSHTPLNLPPQPQPRRRA